MKQTFNIGDALWLGIAFEFALLLATGVLHIVRPQHLAGAAERHRTAGAIPTWLGTLERPVLVGTVEIAAASLALVTGWVGSDAMVLAQACLFALASSLLAFLSVLRRSPSSLPCGCHPFAGEMTNATFVPAASLLVIALFVGVAAVAGASMTTTFVGATSMVLLGVLAATAVLLYAGAASAPQPVSISSEAASVSSEAASVSSEV
jgi:hypothetical protein